MTDTTGSVTSKTAEGSTREQVCEALAAADQALPSVPTPLASYRPAMRAGGLVFTAGQLPMVEGALSVTGRAGTKEVTVARAAAAAGICALNALAAAYDVVDPGEALRLVKVVVFVCGAEDFSQHPVVADGASEMFGMALGRGGLHARSAVGASSLPKDSPVEVEAVFAVVASGAGSELL